MMYSKDRGVTYREVMPRGQGPAYRQPARPPARPRMQVPANYRGNAIVDGEERPMGQAILQDVAPEIAVSGAEAEPPVPTFSHLPRVSELGGSARPRSEAGYVPAHGLAETGESSYDGMDELPEGTLADVSSRGASAAGAEALDQAASQAGPKDLLPVNTASVSCRAAERFPFGHGLGFEELLLVGLILFLLREGEGCPDRGDLDETVILLGLLLFLG